MNTTPSKTTLVIALLYLSLLAGYGQSFQGLGDLPGSAYSSQANGVSADGKVVVGSSISNRYGDYSTEAFRWEDGQMTGLGALPFQGSSKRSVAMGASADGSVVVGYNKGESEYSGSSFRWENGVMTTLEVSLGTSGHLAFDVNADGSVIVGRAHNYQTGELFRYTGYRWQEGTTTELATGQKFAIARGVSADGSVISLTGGPHDIGNYQPYRWDSGAMQSLPMPAGYSRTSTVHRVSANGEFIVGGLSGTSGSVAVRWNRTGELLELTEGAAYDISADGKVVVGAYSHPNDSAFIWIENKGLRNLRELLVESGISLEGWKLVGAQAISDNGRVIVGTGINPQGQQEAWRAELPCDALASSAALTSVEVQAAVGSCDDIEVNVTSDEADHDLEDKVCDVDPEENGQQCSLRAAIETANTKSGADSIVFDIPDGGIHVISPAGALPLITEKVAIDATTQPGYSGSPVVELRGSGADYGLGFQVGGDDSSVSALAINRFVTAIAIKSSGVTVEKCYIGLGADGTAAGLVGTQQAGVLIGTATATNNTIGGTGDRGNVISNNLFGVAISEGATGNKVFGNRIGTNAAGTAAIPNALGVAIEGAGSNRIGNEIGDGNLISGNINAGVLVRANSSDNLIAGNKIGTNAAATAAIPNQVGVAIEGANGNRVGNDTADHGNLISGNSAVGVLVRADSSDNLIAGNKLGTNGAGTEAIPNPAGVIIESANNNRVGTDTGEHGNLISGNSSVGVVVQTNASGNLIAGNQIGTKANGTEVLPNGQHGIFVDTGATENTFKLNVIGGHNLTDNSAGMVFGPSTGLENLVVLNSIGVVANGGTTALPNKYGIANFADGQIIGSSLRGGGNYISHNEKAGIWISAVLEGPNPVVQNNHVAKNMIGTNGTDDLGNGEFGIWLNGPVEDNSIIQNLVSGNGFGIALTDGADSNAVGVNRIGINDNESSAVPNGIGIWIRQSSDNLISANVVGGNGIGILLGTNIGFGETAASIQKANNEPSRNSSDGATFTSGNRLIVNTVGITTAGTAIPNKIGIAVGENARNNSIGLASEPGNVISGNTDAPGMGIFLGTFALNPSGEVLPQFNTFQKNYIGLGRNQTSVSNTKGFVLIQAARNTIGGTTDETANVIAASTEEGLVLADGTRENTILKNFIGVLPEGGLPSNGPSAAAPKGATFVNNEISTAAETYGNGGHGILLSSGAQGNILGGVNPESGLVIANNGGNGINLATTAGNGNLIGANSIYDNALAGVDLGGDGLTPNDPGDADTGPNNLQNYPALVSCSIIGGDLIVSYQVDSAPENSNYGTAGIYVEFFESESSGEGRKFVGSDYYTASDFTSGSPGTKQKNLGNAAALGIAAGDLLTSDASDADGNSSEFAPSVTVTLTVANPTPAPTATATASPSPSPSPSSSPSPSATPTPSAEPTASPSPTPATAPLQLLNISTRLNVQTGENVLIGGIIITGTEPKKVILRAIGPSLAAAIDGALQDPVLELFDGAGEPVTSNDNWRDADEAEINASTIPPGHEAESAIVRILAPGNYTAVVSGKDGATGIGLVEVYDLATSATSQLANISSRGFVETGDNALIGGFIAGGLEGSRPARVVVRALGPSLGEQGVNGALADPTLEIVDANGETVRANDNWRGDQAIELEAIGIQPAHEAESALIATLPAGNYTAVVRGAGDTTGVGLVEVYNVP